MRKKLDGKVVVVTGASSGIGRATAHLFAAEGAVLVLAARSHQALRAVAGECERRGATVLPVVTDVTEEALVRDLADAAQRRFGRIDVWINDAAVTLFGRIEDLPDGAFERVIRTNLLGYVYGARAVIPVFRRQHAGILINVASVVSFTGQPFTSAYVASKWAIRGLGECLRMELMDEPGVHVGTVYPPSIDTPLFQHGANYSGRAVKAMEPVYPPEQVAEVILGMVRRPRRDAFVGAASRVVAASRLVASGLVERVMARQVDRNHFKDQPAPPSPGNLRQPMWDAVHGGWLQESQDRDRAAAGGALLASAALAAGALGYVAWSRRRGPGSPARHVR